MVAFAPHSTLGKEEVSAECNKFPRFAVAREIVVLERISPQLTSAVQGGECCYDFPVAGSVQKHPDRKIVSIQTPQA